MAKITASKTPHMDFYPKTNRATRDQKAAMLEFMKKHVEIASNRPATPQLIHEKKVRMEELAEMLNSIKHGAVKSPEKWLKVWYDWKCDVKNKYKRLRRYKSKEIPGPCPPDMTFLEQNLLEFLGETDFSMRYLEKEFEIPSVFDRATPSPDPCSSDNTKRASPQHEKSQSPMNSEDESDDPPKVTVKQERLSSTDVVRWMDGPHCHGCEVHREDDLRNELFVKLIAEEMKYVMPCARTLCYERILRFVRESKGGHVNEP